MCWNAEVSIQSFGIGLLGIFLAAMTGTSVPTIIFYTTIVFMQLVEYIVWTYGSDPEINFYASLGGAGLLMLQPIASILTVGSQSTRLMMLISYVILGMITHVMDQDGRSLRERYRIEAGPSGDTPLLITKQFDLTALVFLTLGFSIYSFGKGWGSMWCWIVNGMVVMGALKSAL